MFSTPLTNVRKELETLEKQTARDYHKEAVARMEKFW